MVLKQLLKDFEGLGFVLRPNKFDLMVGGRCSTAFDAVWSNGEGPEGPVGGEHLNRLFDSKFFRKTFDIV